ncbi:hypothetical protein [Donghicola tyrosinivorans]|uniref:Uncharacterized protein n=1 Tax=Donghicola tyrosinivorans TaxID=1652492 RepID=A0A2T0W6Y9_9RHOB|nr:hypothetical protein [Donghicola tyrosinivorans]PRY82449.1 hypothetical protein CLV74_1452 [Donghicola tyrosinivorans]
MDDEGAGSAKRKTRKYSANEAEWQKIECGAQERGLKPAQFVREAAVAAASGAPMSCVTDTDHQKLHVLMRRCEAIFLEREDGDVPLSIGQGQGLYQIAAALQALTESLRK